MGRMGSPETSVSNHLAYDLAKILVSWEITSYSFVDRNAMASGGFLPGGEAVRV